MQSHADLIDELGGGTTLAIALWGSVGEKGKHRDAVYKWKQNGISWRWRPAIAELARKRGVKLPADFLLPGHNRAASGRAAQSQPTA